MEVSQLEIRKQMEGRQLVHKSSLTFVYALCCRDLHLPCLAVALLLRLPSLFSIHTRTFTLAGFPVKLFLITLCS